MNLSPTSAVIVILCLVAGLSPAPASAQDAGLVLPFTGEKTSWHEGFDRYDFLMDTLTCALTPILADEQEKFGARPAEKGKLRCIVIAPKQAAPGNPWSWRGCYWDHEPQTEVELLRRGFHIAFIMCDPDRHWDAWYAFLTEKHGLSPKPAFVGMSKGGINEFTWATTHPDKVSCIYADNPALYPESFQKLDQLAAHDVPLLHVCGSYDFLLEHHTLVVEDIYHRLGGRISVMIKEGPGHHPHSLKDPALIAGWIENNVKPETGTPPPLPGLSFDKSYYYSYAASYRYCQPEDTYATCRGPLFTPCYDRYDVKATSWLGITGMTIIMPKQPAAGNPWVFRADRIGWEAEPVDLALLAKGYTIVASPVTEQAGPMRKQWDDLYNLMTSQGYSRKPVMEGTGAGGGEAYYWALGNPDKVSCIYAYNPVLRSLQAKGALVDSLAPLAQAHIPIIHVCGSLDPWYTANTVAAEKHYRQLGGRMEVLVLKGAGHFDALPSDLMPIVNFIVANGSLATAQSSTHPLQSSAHPQPVTHPQSVTHPQPDDYNVSWNAPGPNSAASMPLGNGDIGLNAWVDPNGDLLFYISKTDTWGGEKDTAADPWMQQGGVLMKLGLIRISAAPHRLSPFHQTLRLNNGEITISEGESPSAINYRLWVDANHPVIHVEITGSHSFDATVTLNDWRLGRGDSIIPSDRSHLTWFHRNPAPDDDRLADSHLANITFGATIEGTSFVRKNDTTLSSLTPATTRLISIHPLTATTPDVKDFLQRLGKQTATTDAIDIRTALSAHRQWWHRFWDRSYIYLHDRGHTNPRDTSYAEDCITRGYILQRFVTACAGRGAYPIKFNGSIFVVDNPGWKTNGHDHPMNADFRAWGGQYWFQNTRPMYWPRLAAGDFDEMIPLFRMYLNMLPGNSALVSKYYGHDGAYFQETSPFWGGLPFMGPAEQALYTHHYFTPILELSMMMLDYYEYTGDETFARTYLMPIATAGLEFFDRHFPRDSAGRLLLDPDNSIEMFWKVHDPAPDIAGLHAVLTRMLNLPAVLAPESLINRWTRLLAVFPPLPIDSSDEPGRLLPYTGPQTAKSHNEENPELYAIYPFRIYGLGRPDLALARHSFDIRKCPQKGCWSQDPIEAAMLGYTDIVKEDVRFSLTRKDADLKFPAFWAAGHDYKPDEDNGGNGENGLQQMILQIDGKKILLLPAWPADWDADFKLHAPYRTTVEGKIRNGHLTDLVVTPAARRADIIDCSLPPPPPKTL